MVTILNPLSGLNFAQYIGVSLAQVELSIRTNFPGRVVILKPGEAITLNLDPGRLQIHVDDFGIITRIING